MLLWKGQEEKYEQRQSNIQIWFSDAVYISKHIMQMSWQTGSVPSEGFYQEASKNGVTLGLIL